MNTNPDRDTLRQRIAEALRFWVHPTDRGAAADAVLAVLPDPTDRAVILTEAADALDAYIARYRSPSLTNWTGAVAFLRRLAAEAPTKCGECGHPKGVHREGDDPVTPGTCDACEADDPDEARHDFTGAVEGAR